MVAPDAGGSTPPEPDDDNLTIARPAPPASAAATGVSLWRRAASSAFRGGVSGGAAMVLQVFLLMWLHTAVNYQYKTGVGIGAAFRALYEEGGVRRFYRGVVMALLIAPISRFGDAAANEGIVDAFSSSDVPVWAVTLFASLVAALWRIAITPIDTVKTTLQVSGGAGWSQLMGKIRAYGIWVLWDGAFGNWLANVAGYYPWYAVNNWLELRYPQPARPDLNVVVVEGTAIDDERQKRRERLSNRYERAKLMRRAFIGLSSSLVSACISNGAKVVKTYGQTSGVPLSYLDALEELLRQDGLSFVVRGLELKLITSCLQGTLFSIFWKMFMERMNDVDDSNRDDDDHDDPSPTIETTTAGSNNNNGDDETSSSNHETTHLLSIR